MPAPVASGPQFPDIEQLQLERLLLERDKFRARALALTTVVGYAYDWAIFQAWCVTAGRDALPALPDTISLYLTDLLSRGQKVNTVRRRASAVACQHRRMGFAYPGKEELRQLLNCAARVRAESPRQMRALSVPDLRAIAAAYLSDGSVLALRNRSILTLGFAAALRRSSLAHLEVRDIEFRPEGCVLTLRHEKWNRSGKPRPVGVPRGRNAASCPVVALQDWLGHRGLADGKLYTHVVGAKGRGLRPSTIHDVVLKALALIGLDPEPYGSHSMRVGLVTAAGLAGATDLQIGAHTGHKSLASVRGYFRRTDLWKANACSMIEM